MHGTFQLNSAMAKSSNDSGGIIFKTGLFAVLAGLGFWIFSRSSGNKPGNPLDLPSTPDQQETPALPTLANSPDPIYYPGSTTGDIIQHRYFTLSYNEDHEQAEWVVYEITREHLNMPKADRSAFSFRPDPAVHTESATPRDYSGSGFDRGHLCPAADMSFDTTALGESFYMSNISPQAKGFNTGVWKEMEDLARDWGRKYKRVIVVTGPMLSRKGVSQIGFSKVTVPVGFYKAIYAPEQNIAIGFIVPNQRSIRPVMEYAFNIDYIEKLTGLDFFPQVLSGEQEKVESELDKSLWPVDEGRYQKRIKEAGE